MAEAIGVAASLLGLANFACKSSINLYQAIQSFRSHKRRVNDLADEAKALSEVLKSLCENLGGTNSPANFEQLALPLQRCAKACVEYEKELARCLARSGQDRTSFRDWATLRYLGDDLDGFRRLLSGYKTTICIALTDATLSITSTTAKDLVAYTRLANDAHADFEDRLDMMDGKLDAILRRGINESESAEDELEALRGERISTQKSLEMCEQLSSHISSLQRQAQLARDDASDHSTASTTSQIVQDGLEECKRDLARTVLRLEGHEGQVFQRLLSCLNTDSRDDLAQLKEEWEATRQNRDICFRALEHLKNDVSKIENYAVGDAVQVMVSTNDKTIHGNNRGLGWRTRQIGGHMDPRSLQLLTRAVLDAPADQTAFEDTVVDSPAGETSADNANPSFKGKGHSLRPEDIVQQQMYSRKQAL